MLFLQRSSGTFLEHLQFVDPIMKVHANLIVIFVHGVIHISLVINVNLGVLFCFIWKYPPHPEQVPAFTHVRTISYIAIFSLNRKW